MPFQFYHRAAYHHSITIAVSNFSYEKLCYKSRHFDHWPSLKYSYMKYTVITYYSIQFGVGPMNHILAAWKKNNPFLFYLFMYLFIYIMIICSNFYPAKLKGTTANLYINNIIGHGHCQPCIPCHITFFHQFLWPCWTKCRACSELLCSRLSFACQLSVRQPWQTKRKTNTYNMYITIRKINGMWLMPKTQRAKE